MMTQIVRETQPDIADADIPSAISQIDQSDPRIPARIFGGVFHGSESTSSNTYHCRGTGRAGDGILRTTPGFQKKGASTSSQVAHLSSRLEQTTTQLQRIAEENARMRQYQRQQEEYHRALVEWQQAVADVQDRNNAIQRQWFRDFMMAQAQGLPAPPEPIPEQQPQRPTPPVQQQQQDDEVHGPQQEEDQQRQPDDGPYPQQDPQQPEGEEQQQPDDNEMVNLGLDDWHY